MNNIVIVCGANSSGKSTTLKAFFGIAEAPEYNKRTINGKTVCAVSFGVTFGSPQEQSHFCNFKEVQDNINDRLSICDKRASKPYFCLIPFTMSGSPKRKKTVNRDCILKPIEELSKSYNVFVIYLKKTNTHHLDDKDALIEELTSIKNVVVVRPFILSTPEDYDKSKDLEKLLRKQIVK